MGSGGCCPPTEGERLGGSLAIQRPSGSRRAKLLLSRLGGSLALRDGVIADEKSDRKENVLKELPFGFPGRVFGSPMPFGDFDRDDALDRFVQSGVSVVVVLAEERECFRRSGRDLVRLYKEQGFEVIHVPTEDFGTPRADALCEAVDVALEHARAGRHVAVHCWAGIGRTGMFLACMAARGLGLTPEDAICWVREYIAGAIQTADQEEMVYALGADQQGDVSTR